MREIFRTVGTIVQRSDNESNSCVGIRQESGRPSNKSFQVAKQDPKYRGEMQSLKICTDKMGSGMDWPGYKNV